MHEKILMESPERWDIDATKLHQTSAKMGPNGIIQTFNAVKAHYGEQEANRLLRQAGLEKYIAQLPHQMVDEREFHNLVKAVCETFEPEKQTQILREAGERTAEYLLQARIPKFFQALLKRLPTRWAAKLLLWAIKKHAWTFAGSGAFEYQVAGTISAKILVKAMPYQESAYFYGGALQLLFKRLFKNKLSFNIQTAMDNDTLLCFYSAQILT